MYIKRGLKWLLDRLAALLAYLLEQVRARDWRRAEELAIGHRRLATEEVWLQISLAEELEAVRAGVRARIPESPCLAGYEVYSQADEDGIIEAVLARIATIAPLSRTFIEVGCGNGLENNSHYLLTKGYRGCWCDGSESNIRFIESQLGGTAFPVLRVTRQFLDRDNAADFFRACTTFLGADDPDLLSVDIDGNDLEIVLAALRVCRPKSLCVEYNARFPPPVALTMTYDPAFTWENDDYQGATLQAWCDHLPGYLLVACSLSGVNAFFVRCDLAGGFTRYPIEDLYQPARHRFMHTAPGHRPSLKWLRQIVRRGP
jgi:hypothetical protein